MSDQFIPEQGSGNPEGLSDHQPAVDSACPVTSQVQEARPDAKTPAALQGIKLTGSLFYLFSAACILIGLTKIG
ncbi:MAG: hypothetical protein ACF8OB_20075, partial [Phycisphaeraceae bacterium JB051]